MKKVILLTGLSLFLNACINTQKTKLANFSGTYYANLPYKDCAEVIVDLVIDPDNAYSMLKQPKNNNEEYYEDGIWTVKNNYLLLSKRTS